MGYFIDAESVSVRYTQEDKVHTIFKDLSMRVRRGEFLTVVGPSGCGKSTLLRLFLGAQHPTSGNVVIDGQTVDHVNRNCGIVYQSYSLFPHLTVLDNISLGPVLDQTSMWDRFFATPVLAIEHVCQAIVAWANKRHSSFPRWFDEQLNSRGRLWAGGMIAGAGAVETGAASAETGLALTASASTLVAGAAAEKRESGESGESGYRATALERAFDFLRFVKIRRQYRESAAEFLTEIGLDPSDGDKYPYELSGGMRQRVAIAQAVIMKPKILLMDEPFGALDKARREEMQDFIHQQWAKFGLTVFFVTHDLDEAVKLGTRLICLSQYWCDENKKPGEGSRIVVDRKVMGGDITPSAYVGSEEFKHLVDKIGKAGLDPHHLQPVGQFDLSHDDAIANSSKGIKV